LIRGGAEAQQDDASRERQKDNIKCIAKSVDNEDHSLMMLFRSWMRFRGAVTRAANCYVYNIHADWCLSGCNYYTIPRQLIRCALLGYSSPRQCEGCAARFGGLGCFAEELASPREVGLDEAPFKIIPTIQAQAQAQFWIRLLRSYTICLYLEEASLRTCR